MTDSRRISSPRRIPALIAAITAAVLGAGIAAGLATSQEGAVGAAAACPTASQKLGTVRSDLAQSWGAGLKVRRIHNHTKPCPPPTTTTTTSTTSTTSTTTTPPPDPQPNASTGKTWQLSYDDEFNGSAVDPAKWTVQDQANGPAYGTWGSTASRPSMVTESGGHLRLSFQPNTPYAGSPHSGALLHSHGKVGGDFTREAFVEFRSTLPDHDGAWAGLWTNGWQNWPAGEFDLVETLGSRNYPQVHIHKGATQGSGSDRPWSGGGRVVDPDAYNTWGMWWTDSFVRFYYNGTLQATYTPAADGGYIPSVPEHLILYLTANNGGSPPPASHFDVDYARVWQPG